MHFFSQRLPSIARAVATAALMLLFGPHAAAGAAPPLIFGLLPSESAVAKFKRYAPLRDYLTERLGRQVILETARDFPEFTRRTAQRRYDFLETAPHFVLPAVDSGKYEVRTTLLIPLSAQFVVPAASPIKTLSELTGKTLATPPPEAIITRAGRHYLARHGISGTSAPIYVSYRTHNAAYQAALGGQASAALISVNILNKALSKGAPLRVIAKTENFPNLALLVALDLPDSLRAALEAAFLSIQDTPHGRQILKHLAYPGYRQARPVEFEIVREYMADPPAAVPPP